MNEGTLKQVDKKEIYTGIDICKLISSVLVVLLHTIETSEFYSCEVKFVITRFAVPFFFITSGFFFCKGLMKSDNKKSYFIKYEKNLIKIFIIWGIIIYSPFVVYEYIRSNPTASPLRIILLLFRRIFVIGPGPFWYLVALFWAIAFIYLLYTKKWDNKFLVFSIVFGLILEIIYTCFRGLLSDAPGFNYFYKAVYFVFSWEYNFIMYGIPFAGIGYLIYKKNINLPKKYCVLIFVLSTLLRIFEYNLLLIIKSETFWQNNSISIFFIVQAVSFFLFAKQWKPKISAERSLTIRQLSSFIYFLHAIVLYNIIDDIIGKHISWPIFSPAFIAPKWIVTLLICFLVFLIIKKINNKYLNVLINA